MRLVAIAGIRSYRKIVYIKNIFENGRWDAYPSSCPLDLPLTLSYRSHQKSLVCFSHLAPLVLFCFTKVQSQNGGGGSMTQWLIDFFIFILLSRESGGDAMRRTNPDSLKSLPLFPSFPVEFSSDFFNLLFAKFHQAEIIIVKHLIQGRNSETRVGVEPLTLRSWSS